MSAFINRNYFFKGFPMALLPSLIHLNDSLNLGQNWFSFKDQKILLPESYVDSFEKYEDLELMNHPPTSLKLFNPSDVSIILKTYIDSLGNNIFCFGIGNTKILEKKFSIAPENVIIVNNFCDLWLLYGERFLEKGFYFNSE